MVKTEFKIDTIWVRLIILIFKNYTKWMDGLYDDLAAKLDSLHIENSWGQRMEVH
jgi:hypothetical protein